MASTHRAVTRQIGRFDRAVDTDRFATEEQLVSMIHSTFANSASRNWLWVSELNSPCGIADLVAVKLSRDWQKEQSIRLVPSRWIYPLTCLPCGERFDLKTVSIRYGVSDSCAYGVLSAYTNAGYCIYDTDSRTWIKVKDPRPIAEKIVAVEAKLRDWRRALYQASQYASYASESWVVLDKVSASSASVYIEEFERRGIGLMGISPCGQSEVLIQAANRLPRSNERFWQANAEIAKRLCSLHESAVVTI